MKISQIASLLAAPLLLNAAGAVRADPVYATTGSGQLISFDSSYPRDHLSGRLAITGVAGSLVGIDFRPAAPGSTPGWATTAVRRRYRLIRPRASPRRTPARRH